MGVCSAAVYAASGRGLEDAAAKGQAGGSGFADAAEAAALVSACLAALRRDQDEGQRDLSEPSGEHGYPAVARAVAVFSEVEVTGYDMDYGAASSSYVDERRNWLRTVS